LNTFFKAWKNNSSDVINKFALSGFLLIKKETLFRKTSLLFLLLTFALRIYSYSVLTHEAVIDESWDNTIKPYLLNVYPENNTEEDLRKAKAYAYGGAVLPDMGYFPFGSKDFTNLIHYVRGGDLIEYLIKESKNINELAFSLGLLAHYTADTYGHSIGVNTSIAIMYPKLKKKFGDTITYEESHKAHKRLEFTFDIIQAHRGKYAPADYHRFVGFEIPEELLEKSIKNIYGLQLKDIFTDFKLSVTTYRWLIVNGFPLLTKAAWKAEQKKVKEAEEKIVNNVQLFKLDKKDFRKCYGTHYKKRGIGSSLLSLLIKITPKIGPLKPLDFKAPKEEVIHNFFQSFDHVKKEYSLTLKNLTEEKLDLVNKDFDTGKKSILGEYCLADQTYFYWLKQLHHNQFKDLNLEITKHIFEYYKNDPHPKNKDLKTYINELKQIQRK